MCGCPRSGLDGLHLSNSSEASNLFSWMYRILLYEKCCWYRVYVAWKESQRGREWVDMLGAPRAHKDAKCGRLSWTSSTRSNTTHLFVQQRYQSLEMSNPLRNLDVLERFYLGAEFQYISLRTTSPQVLHATHCIVSRPGEPSFSASTFTVGIWIYGHVIYK